MHVAQNGASSLLAASSTRGSSSYDPWAVFSLKKLHDTASLECSVDNIIAVNKRPLDLLKLAVKQKESEDRGRSVRYLAEDPVAEDAVRELVPERIGAVGGQEPRLSSWSSGRDDAVCCCKVTGRGWRGEGTSDQRALEAAAEQGGGRVVEIREVLGAVRIERGEQAAAAGARKPSPQIATPMRTLSWSPLGLGAARLPDPGPEPRRPRRRRQGLARQMTRSKEAARPRLLVVADRDSRRVWRAGGIVTDKFCVDVGYLAAAEPC